MTFVSQDATEESTSHEQWLSEPLDGLSLELGRISAEIQSINAGFQAEMQVVVANVRNAIQNEYRVRFEKAVADMRNQIHLEVTQEFEERFLEERHQLQMQFQEEQSRTRIEVTQDLEKRFQEERNQLEIRFREELTKRMERLQEVEKEIDVAGTKLQSVTKEINVMLDDPNVELSKIIRKRAEHSELKAYLDGLRFSIPNA